MMFRKAISALLCASVSSFASHSAPFATHSRRFSTQTEHAVVNNAAGTEILPDFQQAMDKASATISSVVKDKKPELVEPLLHFSREYISAGQTSFVKTQDPKSSASATLQRFIEGIQFAFQYGLPPDAFKFGATHDALRGNPETEHGNDIDFYSWGCDFFRPFIDMENSEVMGLENLEKALEQTRAGENVVFFANHQSEADPQVMSCLMEHAGFPEEAAKVIYVAGHKVTTDPFAIPFSMGRNLICIHSKKHMNADPDTKPIKNRENLAAMNGLLDKLKQGGQLIWVAPSGGRDRRDVESGTVPIAPFDSKTVDMFRLMGNRCRTPTHYYPLSMVSYEMCPPPDFVEAGVGEQRNFRFVPVAINVGEELTSEGGLEKRHRFNANAMEQTQAGYRQIRETLFPGTTSEIEV